jgi:hypothetical protein
MQGLSASPSNNIFSNNHLAGCSDSDLEQAYIGVSRSLLLSFKFLTS